MNTILGKPALSTSEISRKLGFQLSGKFIEDELGIPPDQETHTGKYWFETRFCYICALLVSYLTTINKAYIDELDLKFRNDEGKEVKDISRQIEAE